jgi:hypothetical protein
MALVKPIFGEPGNSSLGNRLTLPSICGPVLESLLLLAPGLLTEAFSRNKKI